MRLTNGVKFALESTNQPQARCLACIGHWKSVSWGQWIESWIRNLWGKAAICNGVSGLIQKPHHY